MCIVNNDDTLYVASGLMLVLGIGFVYTSFRSKGDVSEALTDFMLGIGAIIASVILVGIQLILSNYGG